MYDFMRRAFVRFALPQAWLRTTHTAPPWMWRSRASLQLLRGRCRVRARALRPPLAQERMSGVSRELESYNEFDLLSMIFFLSLSWKLNIAVKFGGDDTDTVSPPGAARAMALQGV